MAIVRKTIALTDQQYEWVKTRVHSGDFTNDSEYIRDLIRRDQERSAGMDRLRAALVEGERSGVSDRTPAQIRRAARDKLKADGRIPSQ